MIVLNATTSTLQVVLDAAPATNQLPCSTAYADQGGNASPTDTITAGTTPVTIVPAPASGINRVINSVSIYNADTATRIVTVSKNDNGTLYTQIRASLPPGFRLGYNAARGWGVTDTSGNFLEAVQASQAGAWAVSVSNFPATQVVSGTVTANAGTGTFTVSDSNFIAQGSTTSGQKGLLAQGAVTTAPPTYTTAQTSPFSLTIAGALRTDSSATTQPISGTVTANQGGSNWSINLTQVGGASITLGSKTSANSVPVVIASDQSEVSIIPASLTLSSNGILANVTPHVFGITSGLSRLRLIKIDLFGYTNTLACNVNFIDGSGATIFIYQLPAIATATTAFNVFFTDMIDEGMNNSSGGMSVSLQNAPTAGSVSVLVGASN